MAGLVFVKVALLSDCYLPRLGGIEVQVHDLATHLRAAGHDVEIFTATADPAPAPSRTPHRGPGPASPAGDSGAGALTVHRYDIPLPGGIPINPLAPPAVRRELAAGGFDVAHVHMGVVSPFAVDMVRVAQGLGLPTAITWHCVLDRSIPVLRALGSARRWADRGAALSAVSAMAAARVGQLAPEVDVAVLPNGIDVAQWAPPVGAPGDEERDSSVVRVVSAMRLVRRKRPVDLLEVIAGAQRIAGTGVRIEADIVGAGPQRAAMESHLKSHGLTGIRLHGRVSREELRDLHWRSDVYLTSARLEAFGIAALEARTAGLAVVARRGTGTDDFVRDGVEGLLADSDQGLAEALARLATAPDLLHQITTHNRTTPPIQAWPDVIEATLAEYARAQRQAAARESGAR